MTSSPTHRTPSRCTPSSQAVTERIVARSAATRAAYVERNRAAGQAGPARTRLACANLAHGFAAAEPADKEALRGTVKPNLAIVTSYNDMLSAHQPFETYPRQLKKAVIRAGGIAQVAGGVPAMCDGITQGRAGHAALAAQPRRDRDVDGDRALPRHVRRRDDARASATRSCPGLLIGALSFGHLPTVFVPAGPMESGLGNKEKAAVRQRFAEGLATREELLEAESASYHSAGTCTFYGTANSNQLLMEVLGLHLPGASFPNPGTPLRAALTDAAAARVTAIARGRGRGRPGR